MHKFIWDTSEAAEFSKEKLKKVNLFESHRMFCDVYCLLPGQSQRPHIHNDEDKIYHALSGTCHVQLEEESFPLPPGHVAVAPAGVMHGVVNNSDEPATLLVVMAPHPKLRHSG
jgi:quercetin dioxygenase-like cupin family protein